jgi:hypothetical protein
MYFTGRSRQYDLWVNKTVAVGTHESQLVIRYICHTDYVPLEDWDINLQEQLMHG